MTRYHTFTGASGITVRHTVDEYRVRQWKKSVPGQIFRGMFFALAYFPAVFVWRTVKAAYYVTRMVVIVTAVFAMWALGFRKNITPQLVGAAVPLAAVTAAAHV